jgi:polyphosphate kinase
MPLTSFRYEVPSEHQLDQIAAAPLPVGIASTPARESFHRDIYYDTPDDALRRRWAVFRLRLGSDGKYHLSFALGADDATSLRLREPVRSAEISEALRQSPKIANRIRSIADPSELVQRMELEVERRTRSAAHDWLRRPRIELHFDTVTFRAGGTRKVFHKICGHSVREDNGILEAVGRQLEKGFSLRKLTHPLEWAELMLKWSSASGGDTGGLGSDVIHRVPRAAVEKTEFLNPELSLLEFQKRVLAMAENVATPLFERLRFLAIVSANLDEFYMVRVAGLKSRSLAKMDEIADDGLTHTQQLERILQSVMEIVERQGRCYQQCSKALTARGTRILSWNELDDDAKQELRTRCEDEIAPALVPMAMTLSPGHPLPHLPHLSLSLAVVFRRESGDRAHLAQLELPASDGRFMRVPGKVADLIPVEDVVRANLDLVYRDASIAQAYAFRVTRGGDLNLDEASADNLLQAVEAASGRRHTNPSIRLEVDRAMPLFVRELLLESLRRDSPGEEDSIKQDEIQEVTGLLDLRCLSEIPCPDQADVSYPSFTAAELSGDFFQRMRDGDIFVHHPFDSFEASVTRFIRDAATDPAVTTIKITLYRVGSASPVVDALLDAARGGKRVAAFVELKARFDEDNNIAWAKALEEAGAHVVYGLVSLKNHAKAALVVRREQEKLRRYVHVGTGNYNSRSGMQYTDLSLFSARQDLTADIADLFNLLTGSASAPGPLTRGALVAPHQLLPAILNFIERESANARAGRPASIRGKFNGLSDPDVVTALYEASQAGVEIDLIVRGICTLRPGVPGLSDRIRVTSVLGRFLEHSRIYRFENAGDPQYYIGSADWRPRNLRRRVELLVPVVDAEHQATLDGILDQYSTDPCGWDLHPDGSYSQRAAGSSGAQEHFISVVVPH